MTDTPEPNVPTHDKLMWPTLKAIEALGGSATNAEILTKVIELESIPEDVQAVQHINGNQSKLDYRLAWARTYLKKGGAINNSERGVWAITDKGERLAEPDISEIVSEIRLNRRPFSQRMSANMASMQRPLNFDQVNDLTPEDPDWRAELLNCIKNMEPSAFERLAQRVLRESGFKSVEVTGRSGDGGIDGLGVLQVNLITFSIGFQCKRYAGSVGSPEVRNFRGALDGKCEKGLLITTGNFTSEAQKEANRDGAKSIDLVDGERLCDLLKALHLGVSTKTVEEVTVNPDWFVQI